jgi:hypothetical protein
MKLTTTLTQKNCSSKFKISLKTLLLSKQRKIVRFLPDCLADTNAVIKIITLTYSSTRIILAKNLNFYKSTSKCTKASNPKIHMVSSKP